ncbi:MAG: hypothetical protein HC822_02680 [Oscillochloris sp.]|nr:hypothetical protein [Oscillochloris sp.]
MAQRLRRLVGTYLELGIAGLFVLLPVLWMLRLALMAGSAAGPTTPR